MSEVHNKTVHEIIRSHTIFAMTAGAIPIPLADIAAVTAIQLDMIKQIAAHYEVSYDSNKGKSIASALAGATLARMGASMVKSLPGVGTILGVGMQMVLAGASTYALGNIFDGHFSEKGTFDNFNVDKVKDKYNEYYDKGKKYAKDLKSKFKKDDTYQTIEKLKELKDKGMITEQEYEETKKKLLDKLSA